MSSTQGSSPEDRNAYISGLRNLILDLRNRKVKDLDAIVSEMSAYRAKYSGDASKVLPL